MISPSVRDDKVNQLSLPLSSLTTPIIYHSLNLINPIARHSSSSSPFFLQSLFDRHSRACNLHLSHQLQTTKVALFCYLISSNQAFIPLSARNHYHRNLDRSALDSISLKSHLWVIIYKQTAGTREANCFWKLCFLIVTLSPFYQPLLWVSTSQAMCQQLAKHFPRSVRFENCWAWGLTVGRWSAESCPSWMPITREEIKWQQFWLVIVLI